MLDTDTASYAIRRRSPAIEERLLSIPAEQTCISAITHAELRFGLTKLPPTHLLQHRTQVLLASIPTLPWGEEEAERFATIRFQLQRIGTPIGVLDMMIAAHAIAVGAILVTNNVRHFERIGPPLVLENWHS